MKIDKLIVSAVLAVLISLEAWNLKETVDLKVRVAELTVQMRGLAPNKTIALK